MQITIFKSKYLNHSISIKKSESRQIESSISYKSRAGKILANGHFGHMRLTVSRFCQFSGDNLGNASFEDALTKSFGVPANGKWIKIDLIGPADSVTHGLDGLFVEKNSGDTIDL